MKKFLVLLLVQFASFSQVKQIATFTNSKIPIGATVSYYFIGDNGDVLRPISTDVLHWELTNKTTLSDYLRDNLPSSSGIGIGFPAIEKSVNIAGYRKLYYYDPVENNVGWHYVKNGVTLPFQFTLLSSAKKLIKPTVVKPPVVTVPPVVTPPVVVVPPVVTTPPVTNTGGGTVVVGDLPTNKPRVLSLEIGKNLYNPDGSFLAIPTDIDKIALSNYILTDNSWDSFKGIHRGIGKLKAWKIDNDDWSTTPLKNIQLPTNMAKRTFSIYVAFISGLNDTVGQEVYQTMIEL
jgi:hypothetical protein